MGAWQKIDLASGRVVNVEEWTVTPPELAGILYRQQAGAGPGWTWNGSTLSPPSSAPDAASLSAAVDVERDRRIASGFNYQGERFQSRPQDQDNIRDAYLRALAAIGRSAGAIGDILWFGDGQPFGWIQEDNGIMLLDAPGMVELGDTIGKRKKDLTFAGATLKSRIRAGEAVPDVTADALWPA